MDHNSIKYSLKFAHLYDLAITLLNDNAQSEEANRTFRMLSDMLNRIVTTRHYAVPL